jgi:hypothetical protein
VSAEISTRGAQLYVPLLRAGRPEGAVLGSRVHNNTRSAPANQVVGAVLDNRVHNSARSAPANQVVGKQENEEKMKTTQEDTKDKKSIGKRTTDTGMEEGATPAKGGARATRQQGGTTGEQEKKTDNTKLSKSETCYPTDPVKTKKDVQNPGEEITKTKEKKKKEGEEKKEWRKNLEGEKRKKKNTTQYANKAIRYFSIPHTTFKNSTSKETKEI